MPHHGSYDWWRANYASDPDYLAVSAVLTPLGHDCTEVEVDHFPPNAAYTGTQYQHALSYGARPAFPLPKYLHRYRKGDGGMGGHATTTGKTSVQGPWTGELKTHMQGGNFYAAMRQDVIDKQNVALNACGDRHLFDPLMRPAIELMVHQYGLITQTEAYEIYMNLFDGRC